MNKKAIAILGAMFLLIVGTLGFLIFQRSSKNNKTEDVAVNTDTTPNEILNNNQAATTTPDTNHREKLVQLTGERVISPILFYNGLGVTYFNFQGQLFQADLQNNKGQLGLIGIREITVQKKANLSKIYWPKAGNNFIGEFKQADGKTVWSFFDSTKNTYTDLPSQVFSFDWVPSGEKIIYLWINKEGKPSLNIGDGDAKNYEHISDPYDNDIKIYVSPDGKNIAFHHAITTGSSNNINLTTPDGKLWRGLVKEGFNSGVLWSPDSSKFVYGKLDPTTQKYQLWLYDLLSGANSGLGVFTTVEKAVWSKDGNAIYAAVPVSGTAGTDSLTVDTFYKIDVGSFAKTEFPVTAQNVDGQDLFLDLTNERLFFRNAQDGGLYYLNLIQ